ncbi:MAG: SDR family NAD(P)-dependent oxidoreductase [Campylobacterota bacterium]|nr:SDR family NAD(P)-dependent oxidoreductase [Campylobacterota bacterium]
MNNLKNKTALITGATSGIGKSSAKSLAKMGTNLIITGRREEKLKNIKKGLEKKYNIKVKTLTFDITKQKEVEKKILKVLKSKKIDILINNAGLALDASKIDDCDISDWETMIDTNIKGLLYVSRIVIKHMRENNSGHIINLGSIAGTITYPAGNVYCATKSAVHTLSEAMNIDLVGTNIRVSNVAPGAVETEFSNVRFKGNIDKIDAVYNGYTPLSAKDISDLIIYILNAPLHVNIQHTLIMPTAQRNPYTLYRDNQ